MNEDIIFSFYQKNDFEPLLNIILEFRFHLERTPEKKAVFSSDNIQKDEREFLKFNSGSHYYSFFIAKSQNEIVGYIWFGQQDEDRTKGFIGELFVRNNFRKRGIAKVLLQEAQKWIENKKCSEIEIDVHQTDTDTMKLYESFGFVQQNQSPIIYKKMLI